MASGTIGNNQINASVSVNSIDISEAESSPVGVVENPMASGGVSEEEADGKVFFSKETDPIFVASPSFNIMQTEIDNWKTYRNEEYGFEMKYPQNWKVRKDEEIYFGESKEVITAGGEKILIGKIGFSIAFYDNVSKLWGNKNNLSLEDWIFEFLLPLQEGEIKQTITFGENNYNGILLKKEKGVGVISLITTIYVKRDNSIYELKGEVPTITSSNFPTEYDYDKVFNQMLSTFKFLE